MPSLPTTYTWPLVQQSSGDVINPGPPVTAKTLFGLEATAQFARGIKFANVPGGQSVNVQSAASQVYHVNTTVPVVQTTSDKRDLSGAVRFRFRKQDVRVPASIRK